MTTRGRSNKTNDPDKDILELERAVRRLQADVGTVKDSQYRLRQRQDRVERSSSSRAVNPEPLQPVPHVIRYGELAGTLAAVLMAVFLSATQLSRIERLSLIALVAVFVTVGVTLVVWQRRRPVDEPLPDMPDEVRSYEPVQPRIPHVDLPDDRREPPSDCVFYTVKDDEGEDVEITVSFEVLSMFAARYEAQKGILPKFDRPDWAKRHKTYSQIIKHGERLGHMWKVGGSWRFKAAGMRHVYKVMGLPYVTYEEGGVRHEELTAPPPPQTSPDPVPPEVGTEPERNGTEVSAELGEAEGDVRPMQTGDYFESLHAAIDGRVVLDKGEA